MSHPFDPAFDQLPATLPIFPLPGILLLPRGKLPLNIFEPRYLAMVRDALRSDRLIGMIQPSEGAPGATEPVKDGVPVYSTGCAGRITTFSETDDGRFLVTLRGLIRFTVVNEIPTVGGYRRVVADYARFRADFDSETATVVDRPRLIGALRAYFTLHNISADWDAITQTADEKLVTSLAMICPFESSEKQALLESANLAERCRLMTALIEMAVLDRSGDGEAARH